MNLTLNSHGSPNVAGAGVAGLTALLLRMDLGMEFRHLRVSSKSQVVTADGITCVGQRQLGEPGKVDMQNSNRRARAIPLGHFIDSVPGATLPCGMLDASGS